MWSFSLTTNQAEALRERNLDPLKEHLEAGGLTGVEISLSMDPPVLKVAASASPTALLQSYTWPQRRDTKANLRVLREFAAAVDSGATPPARTIIQTLRAVIALIELDN